MSGPSSRSPRPPSDRPHPPVTGDLFAHFGVEERARGSGELPPVRPAQACNGCGWFLASPPEPTCPQCGATRGGRA